MKNKVFGVGFQKTGLSTFRECGKILGHRVRGYSPDLLREYLKDNETQKIKNIARRNSWFADWPWTLLYKELDQWFPNSKFVLTTRASEEEWIESLKKHTMRCNPCGGIQDLIYGYNYPHKHVQEHIDIYKEHNNNVREYFSGRDNFIELCWKTGDDFQELCNFLGEPIPNAPFPHKNSSKQRRVRPRFLKENTQKMLEEN